MKILQILQKPQLRGAEIFAAQLSEKLIAQGHQVALLYLFSGEDILPYKGLKIHLHGDPKNRLWDIRGYRRLAKIIRDFKPDIIQANAGDTLKYASLSRFLFGWKGKLVFRNANLISAFIDTPSKKEFNRLLLKQVDAVASVSQHCLDDFQSVFSWKKPIACLPIGTEPINSAYAIPDDLAQKLKGRPFLVHIAGFVAEKNHQGLIRIIKTINQSFPDVCLVLIGDGPFRSQIESQLPKNVISLGTRKDAGSILQAAQALLLPSLIEGLPGVILEAMVMEVPVIAYQVGGIPEVISHLETGFLIPKGDEEAFAKSVISYILTPFPKLKQITWNARNRIENQYSLDLISRNFESFYFSLLNQVHAHSYS